MTDRQLRLCVGLAVVLACCAVAANIWLATWQRAPMPSPSVLILVCGGVIVSHRFRIYVRIRSSTDGVTWGEVPILIGLLYAPMPWVVLCVGAGMAALKISTRVGAQKAAFSVAKEILNASAAGVVLLAFGVLPGSAGPPFAPLALALAYFAMSLVDTLVFAPLMAVVSHSSIWRVLRHDWMSQLIGYAVRLAAILLVVAVLAKHANQLLLVVVPLLAACMHLWHSRRVRTREERESWQRLSKAIDALNVIDLTEVLRLGATRLVQIFSADYAEIVLAGGGEERLVRGTATGVDYDGPEVTGRVRDDDAVEGSVVVAELETSDGEYRAGVLRLRFDGRVLLTEFEQYKLMTFASALCTAIRNSRAYAELARVPAENEYAAMHDPLTGLANRRKLWEHAGDIFDARPDDGILALLLIDLNHFKEVNDTLGHAAGDRVLCEVAHRLQAAARPGDLVARLGGDEFAVLLTGLPAPAMAAHWADAMLSELDPNIEVDGMQLSIEAAGGIAMAPGSGGVQELMRRADVAMYQAKRSGRRTVSYLHAQDTSDLGRLTLGTDLRRAVEQQEFFVDFQPIVDLGSGEVISAEALARWHHPEHGNLTPMDFLETVERSGRLAAFADAVLGQSLTAIGTWRAAGFDLPIAVNVSPRSLLDPDFPAAVLSRLAEHDVPADRLVLELTETLTLSQLEVVARALGDLREAGVRLALDDFGTGHSSLSVLSRLPVHQLKIDREFVLAVETSSEAAAVIRSTVDLARSLQLTVIAEGVESEPQRHALWDLGCVAGQGYLFARPMRADRLLSTMQRGSGGKPGVLAAALYDAGSVVRMPRRRSSGGGRASAPHLPA